MDIAQSRKSPPDIVLRESYHFDGKIKTRTLQNLTRRPETKATGFGGGAARQASAGAPGEVTLERPLRHGDVTAIFHAIRSIRLYKRLTKASPKAAKLMLTLVAGRAVATQPKRARATGLERDNGSQFPPRGLGTGRGRRG